MGSRRKRQAEHLLTVTLDPDGRKLYRLDCTGITEACRTWREAHCAPDCTVVRLDIDAEDFDDDEDHYDHGARHRYLSSCWMIAEDHCFWAADQMFVADMAHDLNADPGVYRVRITNSDYEINMQILDRKDQP